MTETTTDMTMTDRLYSVDHCASSSEAASERASRGGGDAADDNTIVGDKTEEKQPSAEQEHRPEDVRDAWWRRIPRAMASAVIGSLRWFLAALASPGVYLIALFHDDGDSGEITRSSLWTKMFAGRRKEGASARIDKSGIDEGTACLERQPPADYGTFDSKEASTDNTPSLPSPGQAKSHRRRQSSRHSATASSDDVSPTRRSIRIKLSNDSLGPHEGGRPSVSSASRSSRSSLAQSQASESEASPASDATVNGTVDTPAVNTTTTTTDHSMQFKSPTSPGAALTRYPRTPAPPRPLVPRRQPSYVNIEPSKKHQKTLILDLDETLIHSISKGGRMSTGHMVEVRLTTTYLGHGGQTTVGPQHPILYWVNKRPHCDDFLRRVCKWYNLVIFTASVPEYADPVIDWLEQERKFFSGRYYRQHCTFRQGAFIKDLGLVETDLSRVMILDNSPLSYMFHQDNAIPIQGWINDPTDNDLLHLVPLLEGLQYVSDVRALLALRGGEDGHHMA